MSQSNDDAKKGPGHPESRPGQDPAQPKRPFATIDLKATEIKPPEAKVGAKTESKPAAPASSAPDAARKADAKPAAASPPGAAKPNTPDAAATARAASTASSAGQQTAAKPATASANPGTPGPKGGSSGSGAGRFLAYTGAALLGAVLALLGMDYVTSNANLTGLRGAAPRLAVGDELGTRLARLEKAMTDKGLPATPGDPAIAQKLSQQLADSNARIARLEDANKQLAAIAETQQRLSAETKALVDKVTGNTPAADEVGQRMAKLEETLQGLATVAQTPSGRAVPEFARINAKLAEMETALAALKKAASADVSGQIGGQIDARLAEARKSEAQTLEAVNQLKADGAKRIRDIEAIKTQTEQLMQRIDGVTASFEQSVGVVRGEAGGVKAAVEALKSDVSGQLQSMVKQTDVKSKLEPVETRITDLDNRVAALAKRDLERSGDAKRTLLLLQFANLKRVMDTGRGYSEILGQIEVDAAGAMDLTPLKAFRESGVPPITELQSGFRAVARAVLDAEQEAGQASTLDRLLTSAKSVVQVRRVGKDVEGTNTEAVLARTEGYLKAGDIAQALKEAQGLQPESRKPIQPWLARLEARASVDQALATIENKLKASLADGAASTAPGAGGKVIR